MSEQTQQPEQASQTNAVQSSSDAPQTNRDDAPPTLSPNGEETTAADTVASANPLNPPTSDEIGEPTAPMRVQPAMTIQVPALTADAGPSAAPPPNAKTETTEQTQVAAPPTPASGPA